LGDKIKVFLSPMSDRKDEIEDGIFLAYISLLLGYESSLSLHTIDTIDDLIGLCCRLKPRNPIGQVNGKGEIIF